MEEVRGGEKELIRAKRFGFYVVKFQMKIFCGIFILALVTVTGCVTKSQSDAEVRAAFIEGERTAYQQMQSSATDIIVLGNVDKHDLPWAQGLTLTQALAAADYKGLNDPQTIFLRRNTVQTRINPRQLLNGEDVPLQPGDVISVIGQ